jgi:hypothetical protein
MAGKLEKMKMKAIEDGKVTTNKNLMYDVLVNPETYTVNHVVKYNATPSPPGTTGQNQQFVRTLPTTLQFDFIFDSTGVIPKPLEGLAGALSGVPVAGAIAGALSNTEKYDILYEIEKFKQIVYIYHGSSHAPRKVQLIWGTLFFEANHSKRIAWIYFIRR